MQLIFHSLTKLICAAKHACQTQDLIAKKLQLTQQAARLKRVSMVHTCVGGMGGFVCVWGGGWLVGVWGVVCVGWYVCGWVGMCVGVSSELFITHIFITYI